jgi:WD40 repeat protein
MRSLQGHHKTVYCAAISHDGKFLASGSADETVKVWEADTGLCRHTLTGYIGSVLYVDFHKDGDMLVCSGSMDNKIIKVWSINKGGTPTVLRKLTGHTSAVWCAKFSPDGAKIASCSEDEKVKIWSVHSGEQLLELRGHSGKTYCVAWSSDCKFVASGGADHKVHVWDPVTGMQVMKPMERHTDIVGSVVFNTARRFLVSSSHDKTIMIWDLREGHAMWRCTLYGHADVVKSVSLSPDDKMIVSGSCDRTIRVWEVATQQQVSVLEGHEDWVNSTVWSRDGKHIVSSSDDMTVRVWKFGEQVCMRGV